jgi:hypothetical protein
MPATLPGLVPGRACLKEVEPCPMYAGTAAVRWSR